ncbi:hypothetical protein IPH67_04415 [bacterium]|nr:MAG: hypothetical protein IPH67_04415 [bacterium]
MSDSEEQKQEKLYKAASKEVLASKENSDDKNPVEDIEQMNVPDGAIGEEIKQSEETEPEVVTSKIEKVIEVLKSEEKSEDQTLETVAKEEVIEEQRQGITVDDKKLPEDTEQIKFLDGAVGNAIKQDEASKQAEETQEIKSEERPGDFKSNETVPNAVDPVSAPVDPVVSPNEETKPEEKPECQTALIDPQIVPTPIQTVPNHDLTDQAPDLTGQNVSGSNSVLEAVATSAPTSVDPMTALDERSKQVEAPKQTDESKQGEAPKQDEETKTEGKLENQVNSNGIDPVNPVVTQTDTTLVQTVPNPDDVKIDNGQSDGIAQCRNDIPAPIGSNSGELQVAGQTNGVENAGDGNSGGANVAGSTGQSEIPARDTVNVTEEPKQPGEVIAPPVQEQTTVTQPPVVTVEQPKSEVKSDVQTKATEEVPAPVIEEPKQEVKPEFQAVVAADDTTPAVIDASTSDEAQKQEKRSILNSSLFSSTKFKIAAGMFLASAVSYGIYKLLNYYKKLPKNEIEKRNKVIRFLLVQFEKAEIQTKKAGSKINEFGLHCLVKMNGFKKS